MRTAILSGALLFLVIPASAQFQQQDIGSNQLDGDSLGIQTAGLVKHDIGKFRACGFFARRGRSWQKKFSDGATLEVRCEPDPGSLLPGYHVWYSAAGAPRVEVGRCIFLDGYARGWYYTRAETEVLSLVVWETIDGGNNDGGNRWLDRERTHRTGNEEPYLDIAHWIFDPQKRELKNFSDKYLYAQSKPKLPVGSGAALQPYIGPRVTSLRQSFVKTF